MFRWNYLEKNFGKVIFVSALTVRLIVLLCIFTFTPKMSVGFLSDSYLQNDDVRYETGGMYYAETAESPVDKETFTQAYISVNDYVGLHLGNPFKSLSLWHWTVCLILYFTKNVVFVRLLNVLISSAACVIVYKFAQVVSEERVARGTACLLAFLPYPVVFSCFSYRDHLIMALTFAALFLAAKYHRDGRFSYFREWIILGSIIMVLLMIRSGLPLILFGLCVFIMFGERLKRIDLKYYILILMGVCLVGVVFLRYSEALFFKFGVYISGRASQNPVGALKYLNINGIRDIYKLPFTYMFSVIMPISLNNEIVGWADIIGHINIIMVFISTGSLMYAFMYKRTPLVYWACIAYYLVSIVASLGIFRHYFSLLPIIYLAFSEFYFNRNRTETVLWLSLSTAFGMALIGYYYILA